MSTLSDNKDLTGTWKNGQIVLDEPADWPEGCKLWVAPIPQPPSQTLSENRSKQLMTRDGSWTRRP
jgi:hypothetical protein